MSSSPKVSVIIATYGRERVLCDTIRQVLSEPYGNKEVLVIDLGQPVLEPRTNDVVREHTKPLGSGVADLGVTQGAAHTRYARQGRVPQCDRCVSQAKHMEGHMVVAGPLREMLQIDMCPGGHSIASPGGDLNVTSRNRIVEIRPVKESVKPTGFDTPTQGSNLRLRAEVKSTSAPKRYDQATSKNLRLPTQTPI